MQPTFRLVCCLAVGAFAAATPAHALSTQTFSNLAAFQAATGATSATGALPSQGAMGNYSASMSSATVGSVSFAAPSFVFTEWSTLLPGAELGVSNGAGTVGGSINDGLDATFNAPVFSAGFDFHQSSASTLIDGCNTTPCVDSQFEVTLKNGAATVATFAWTPLKDQRDFFGVWSDTAFTKLEIRETVGSDDNELYGQFYSGVTAVPEPATAALWVLGLMGLCAVADTRKRHS